MGFRCLFLFLFLCWSCTGSVQHKDSTFPTTLSVFNDSLTNRVASAFSERQINGCFILYDVKNDTALVYNQSRADEPFLPASTFKILNSLISLECGSIKNVDEIILWDSVERFLPEWNRDQNMRSAIKYSTVWFYQELARRTGAECMQTWVDSVGYGNRQIGKEIDDFWLVGDLRITPQEQLDFLRKFQSGDLPFKKENILSVKEILIADSNEQYIFRAKTGWSDFGQPIGWYIGYIEIKGDTYIFVNNIDINDAEDGKARKSIVKEILDKTFHIDLNI